VSFDLNSSKPIIIYPSWWTYAIMGLSEESMRTDVAPLLRGLEHEVHFSRKNGKYCSLHVKVVVQSEVQRNEIFQSIQKLPSVQMIL
jgi:putative lipoic acid-binding regulatory protein